MVNPQESNEKIVKQTRNLNYVVPTVSANVAPIYDSDNQKTIKMDDFDAKLTFQEHNGKSSSVSVFCEPKWMKFGEHFSNTLVHRKQGHTPDRSSVNYVIEKRNGTVDVD